MVCDSYIALDFQLLHYNTLQDIYRGECTTCTLPENARSFQGISHADMNLGHLGYYVHSLVVYKLCTPSILVVIIDIRTHI